MPLRKVSNKEFKMRFKPWISHEILDSITKKNKLFKKYVKCKNVVNKSLLFDEYKRLKNQILALTRESKKDFYKNYFTKNSNNLKMVWQGIKQVINIKSKHFDQPSCLIRNDKQIITDQTEIANEFNNYFTSAADEILKKRKYHGNKSFRDYLLSPLANSFVLSALEIIIF